MQADDLVRLRHMRDAARDARAFIAGKTREQLDTDKVLRLALVKCVEIIGEAAARVSPACKALHPDIPWADIIGMRNRLIHGYADVNLDTVWQTVTEELPPLVAALEKIAPPGEEV